MKKKNHSLQWLITLTIGIIAVMVIGSRAYADNNTAVGYWKTVDDKTGQVLSVVQIYPAQNMLQGKIVKIMPVLGQKTTDVCDKCKGALQNKPMLNLVIISDMAQTSPNTWSHGRVLDPKSGKIYKGNMQLINNGANLKLRGYIGVPILGRSETWIRTQRP